MDALIEKIISLLNSLGLSPILNSIIIISLIVIGYFVLRYLKRRSNRGEKISDELQVYAKTQGEELIEAYRLLYEGEINTNTDPVKFVQIVSNANKRIMAPYTKYKLLLDKSVRLEIINIHNILEQFLHDPSKEAVNRFINYKETFYKMVDKAGSVIEKKCI